MRTVLVYGAVLALVSASFAQTASEPTKEQAAVIANARAYEAAFNKGDVKALVAFFAEDAEYTTENGRTFSGISAIEESIRAFFLGNKGAKLAINVSSVRVLAAEVVLEKGSTSVTSRSGETSGSLYSIIHVKKGDKWKISQLVESPLPELTPHDHLTELAWLIGSWEDVAKNNDLAVQSQFVWARGGNYITRNMTVKRGGDTVIEGFQIIGWDPLEQRIHSWTFDGDGGFSDGMWTREGERWLVRETGVNPDGGRFTADNTYSRLSADRISWQSNNRTLDGDPLPSIDRVEIVRVKGN